MARPISARVAAVRAELRRRLGHGTTLPGERFLSTRELAGRDGVSYQTAARLLAELVREGLLVRRRGSGTYVAGEAPQIRGVHLVFHPRGLRPDSFGRRLHGMLTAALGEAGIAWREHWRRRAAVLPAHAYPVLWEVDPVRLDEARGGRFALVLNHRPPPGLRARFVDSVQVDDFSGGCAAAEVLRRAFGVRRAAILAGPRRDPRSDARIAGYRTIFPAAPAIHARSWYKEGALLAARRLLASRPAGLLCANDRLAEAVIETAEKMRRPRPPLVGFDDAPVAARLGLTTIAIPWREFVTAATRIIAARLGGDTRPARQVILQAQAVVRG